MWHRNKMLMVWKGTWSMTWHFNRGTFYSEAGGCLDKTMAVTAVRYSWSAHQGAAWRLESWKYGVTYTQRDSSQLEPGHFQSAGRKFGFVVVKHFGTCTLAYSKILSSSSPFPHTCHESLWTKSRDVRHYWIFKSTYSLHLKYLCYDSLCMSHVEDVI